MFLKRRGSITVFICIVLAVLIPLCCILTDLARYSMAKRQAETALKTCAESMLAAYDRQLREQYGLFAMYPRDTEAMEEEIFELLSRNLNAGLSAEGVSDLYGFKVRKVEVIPFYNLSEPYVLKQQVAEFMKYRGPAQVVQEFFEKLKVIAGLRKEVEMVDDKMGLDRLMNDIRGSLVNLHFMLNEKIGGFNAVDGKNLKDGQVACIKNNTSRASEEIEKANIEAAPLQESQTAYARMYPQYETARKNYKTAEEIHSSESSSLDNINSSLEKAKSGLSKARTETEKQEINARIISLEADLADAAENYGRAQDTLSEALQEFTSIEYSINNYKKDIVSRTSAVIQSLTMAMQYNDDSYNQLNILLNHITKHERFQIDLIAIIDELTPSLAELDKQSAQLQNETLGNDSTVSDRIQGDLEKQLKCMRKETFTALRGQLANNLLKLQSWKQAISVFLTVLNQTGKELDEVLKSAVIVQDDPLNGGRYLGYSGYAKVTTGLQTMDSDLSDLKPLQEMKEIYAIPSYSLEPKPTDTEKKAFIDWFNKRYNGIDSIDSPGNTDNGDLKQIREGIGSFANEVGAQGEANPGAGSGEEAPDDISLGDERKAELPSVKGALSSDEALKKIGGAIFESAENQTVNESPLDKPVEGLDTVNENEKNFFNYEIQRMLEVMDVIGKLVENGIESIVEDLYMNEYIVSAFKSAAINDEIEHDIGWRRPLEHSFFKKAEVEYIIFGKASERANISASKRSVFAIRLIFNLLHVYTDPEKISTTLSAATAIAGWTIFGVPVVQNFLLISWAGLESYVDTDILLKGQQVPLIKTSSSWYLGAEKLVDYLKNILLKDIKEFAYQQIEEKVNHISATIEETIMGIISSKIDEAFASVENGLGQTINTAASGIQGDIDSWINNHLISSAKFDNLDSFASSIDNFANGFVGNFFEMLRNMAQDQLAGFKQALKEKIQNLIFKSPLYTDLVERVKSVGNDLVSKGIGAVEGQIDKVFGMTGNSRSNNLAARLILMDYTDYLRLMLLAVPAEKKALRTADLMELNMQEVSEDDGLSIDQYNTFVFIKAELDFNTWFLPERLFKKNDAGMISVDWSQGY